MKRIIVLIDFTPTADISVQQAISIAKKHGSEVILTHVVKSSKDEAQSKMEPFAEQLSEAGIQNSMEFPVGDLYSAIAETVSSKKPDLVIVGTHGKVGVKQHLFGSNIYKLVRKAGSSVLVVSDKFKAVEAFSKILVPLSSHEEFIQKLEKLMELKASDGKVVLLNIDKQLSGLPEALQKNLDRSKRFLAVNNIIFEYIERTPKMASVGYAKDTLAIAEEIGADLIAITTRIGDVNKDAAKLDKENVLLNDKGIAVFCSNEH
jgi:nucleotide-binding universal stress UspA family protein